MFAMSGISRFSPENVGCPARRSCPLSFPSMSPGSVNGGSSTSIKKPGAGSASHSCNNLGSITGVPRSSHSSMHSRSSHIPFTFFRKQTDLPTPPRFVKFIPRASSLTQGAVRTVPTSDHVPELMKPQSSPLAGIAAIADAVSWHAGTINFALRSEEHTSELQSLRHLVCRLLLEKKNTHSC